MRSSDIRKGRGEPRLQRYRVTQNLYFLIEYGAEGSVAVVQLCSLDYSGLHSPPLFPSETLDMILDRLLPGVTTSGVATLDVIAPGFLRERREVPGGTLLRDYPLTGRSEMIAATLSVEGIDLRQTIRDVALPFGWADVEQFVIREGCVLNISYREDGEVLMIGPFSKESHLLERVPMGRVVSSTVQ